MMGHAEGITSFQLGTSKTRYFNPNSSNLLFGSHRKLPSKSTVLPRARAVAGSWVLKKWSTLLLAAACRFPDTLVFFADTEQPILGEVITIPTQFVWWQGLEKHCGEVQPKSTFARHLRLHISRNFRFFTGNQIAHTVIKHGTLYFGVLHPQQAGSLGPQIHQFSFAAPYMFQGGAG